MGGLPLPPEFGGSAPGCGCRGGRKQSRGGAGIIGISHTSSGIWFLGRAVAGATSGLGLWGSLNLTRGLCVCGSRRPRGAGAESPDSPRRLPPAPLGSRCEAQDTGHLRLIGAGRRAGGSGTAALTDGGRRRVTPRGQPPGATVPPGPPAVRDVGSRAELGWPQRGTPLLPHTSPAPRWGRWQPWWWQQVTRKPPTK